jgi:hypothetical protein
MSAARVPSPRIAESRQLGAVGAGDMLSRLYWLKLHAIRRTKTLSESSEMRCIDETDLRCEVAVKEKKNGQVK